MHSLAKKQPGLTHMKSTPPVISVLLIRVVVSTISSVTPYPSSSTGPTPISQTPYLSLSHSFFVSHTLSSRWAPMVTCEPSKQDRLSTHKSQQCACPLSLAHPAWQQKHHQRLPPPEAPTTSPFKCQPPRLKSQTAM